MLSICAVQARSDGWWAPGWTEHRHRPPFAVSALPRRAGAALSPYLPAPSSRAARSEPRRLAPSPSGVVRLAGGEGTDHRGVVLGGTRRDGNGNGNIMLMETR
jgi:hypothetical protein